MAAKKNKVPEKVGSVTLAKADEKLVRAALIAQKVPKKDVDAMSFPDAVKKLQELFEKHKGEMADCDTCGGASPTSLDACPFCGDDGEAEDEGGDDEEETEEKEEAADPPAAEEKAEGKEKGKEKSKALAKPAPTMAELVPEGVTVEKLDGAVASFIRAKGAGAGAMWDLGKAAQEIYDGQLWKARISESAAEDGTVTRKNTYKSWNEFCGKELGMTPTNVYNLMDVARAFPRDKVVEFGTTKLALILKAPEEAQPALLEAAKTHSKRELSAKVDEASKGKKGKRKTGRKETPKGKGRAKKAISKKDVITIAALIDKKFEIPLFDKPKAGEEPSVRATKIEGDKVVVGWKELENKVNLVFSAKLDSTGKLKATIVFKPVEDEDEEEEGEETEAGDEAAE